jgi:hypothetical protein
VKTGTFLACPTEFEGKKIYQLHTMTPYFHHGGCVTLDWLVLNKVKKETEPKEINEQPNSEAKEHTGL